MNADPATENRPPTYLREADAIKLVDELFALSQDYVTCDGGSPNRKAALASQGIHARDVLLSFIRQMALDLEESRAKNQEFMECTKRLRAEKEDIRKKAIAFGLNAFEDGVDGLTYREGFHKLLDASMVKSLKHGIMGAGIYWRLGSSEGIEWADTIEGAFDRAAIHVAGLVGIQMEVKEGDGEAQGDTDDEVDEDDAFEEESPPCPT